MENQEQLKNEILDLLNQVMLKLEGVTVPEIDDEYDSDLGFSSIPVSFKDRWEKGVDLTLPSVKVVVEGLLDNLNSTDSWNRGAEKMARAYYSSFCNG